jgi:hypothetical protein
MNRTELYAQLAGVGIPDSLYSIRGVHELPTYRETFYVLGGPSPDQVLVGVYERGRYRYAYQSHDDEAAYDRDVTTTTTLNARRPAPNAPFSPSCPSRVQTVRRLQSTPRAHVRPLWT